MLSILLTYLGKSPSLGPMTGVWGRTSGHLPAMERRRLLERLELLSGAGVGFEAIAPSACEIFRLLVRADSASVFWVDEQGRPSGFYHDSAPVELKDFFVAHFDAMFSDPDELNMVGLMRPRPPAIGMLLQPGMLDRYRQSNVYKHLCQPLGHEYLLDLRIDIEGRGRALLCAWNGANRPFGQREIATAVPVREALLAAFVAIGADPVWHSLGSRTAHFITDARGARLLAIDAEAEALLQKGHLLRQNISIRGDLREAPSLAIELAQHLEGEETAELNIPVAGGRLAFRAVRSMLRTGGDDPQAMLVSVDWQEARVVQAVNRLCDLPLTMLQKRIALYAMQGGRRNLCEVALGISAEALKKHLGAIYAALHVDGWSDLAQAGID